MSPGCSAARSALAALALSFALNGCRDGTASAPAAAAPTPSLFFRRISDAGADQPRPLVLSFEEVRRTNDTSVVRLAFTSGASVPSSMWFMRCTCALARARGFSHFVILSDGPNEQVVGFSNDGSIDPRTHFKAAPDGGSGLKFESVARLERLVGDSGTLRPTESSKRDP